MNRLGRCSVHPLINYDLYTAPDSDEMAALLGEVFARRDPPAVAAGLTPSEFEGFVRLFCPKADADPLTIVARSAETGEMCGALLTEDSASEWPDGVDRLSEKFNPVFDLLGPLDEEYRDGRAAEPGESVHLFLLGVAERFAGQGVAQQLVDILGGLDEEYRGGCDPEPGESLHLFLLGVAQESSGQGVGKRLVEECLANGARHGYRRAVTEATNLTSQHVFRKHGFVERVRRSYRDHRFEGRAVFASIAEHGGPILMDKQLAGASE